MGQRVLCCLAKNPARAGLYDYNSVNHGCGRIIIGIVVMLILFGIPAFVHPRRPIV
jgi:hypothetical protein